jgi:hypothetical protein
VVNTPQLLARWPRCKPERGHHRLQRGEQALDLVVTVALRPRTVPGGAERGAPPAQAAGFHPRFGIGRRTRAPWCA